MRKVMFGLPLALVALSVTFGSMAPAIPGGINFAQAFVDVGEMLSPAAGSAEPPLANLHYLTEDWEVAQSSAIQSASVARDRRSPGVLGGHPLLRRAAESKAASLQESLSAEQQRGAELEAQRDVLVGRNAALEGRLKEMRAAQETVLNRVRLHTLLGIVKIEDALSMTGLDVGALLPDDPQSELPSGQGGPFIPGGIVKQPDPVGAVHASLAGLDLQIGRWQKLQSLLGSLPLAAPLEQYRISSTFGVRRDPINGKQSKHNGSDFVAALGTPVLSTAPGKVAFAGWAGRFGRLVVIDHGFGIKTRYAHLKKIEVKLGEPIGHRQKIGLLGNSGRSTGAHVHYEILVQGKPRDPLKFLEAGMHLFKNAGQEGPAAIEVSLP